MAHCISCKTKTPWFLEAQKEGLERRIGAPNTVRSFTSYHDFHHNSLRWAILLVTDIGKLIIREDTELLL